MKISWLRFLALSVTAASAACVSVETIGSEPCPPEGTNLSYDNFGSEFIRRYCQGCHASGASNRQGAPADVIFDTLENIRQRADRIYARSARGNTSMPPGPDDPSVSERDDLAQWLVCAAP